MMIYGMIKIIHPSAG